MDFWHVGSEIRRELANYFFKDIFEGDDALAETGKVVMKRGFIQPNRGVRWDEAIRPTDVKKKPSEMKKYLSTDQAKLYELIWKRTISSQMSSAVLNKTSIDISTDRNIEQHIRVRSAVKK